jgi:hypothetical protein
MAKSSDRVSAQDFTILPWGGMPAIGSGGSFWSSAQSMDDAVRDLWECGFNTTGFCGPDWIEPARKYKIAVILQNSKIGGDIPYRQAVKEVRELIGEHVDDPAVLGVCLRDEPIVRDYPHLAKWAKAVLAVAPNQLPYINLLPNYDGIVPYLGAESYDDYLDKFVAVCNPKFLSYDNYSLFERRGLDADRFYSNLEAMRAAALRHKLPFWNIILGNAHFTYSEPTQASISVQVYSSLAYGVRGLSYFTYYSPIIGNYRLAAIDHFNNRTPTWNYVRYANLQMHKLMPHYLKLKSINVFHYPNIPAGCQGLQTSKVLAELKGNDLLVGEFMGPRSTPYVMVVNKSLTDSTHFGVKFKKTEDKAPVKSICSYTGEELGFEGENCWLAPGQGMLLKQG